MRAMIDLVKWLVVCALLTWTSVTYAQPQAQPPTAGDIERARTLFLQGIDRVERERWGEALPYFEQSLAIVERPSTMFNIGSVLFRMGRTEEAQRALERYLAISDQASAPQERAEAQRLLAELRGAGALLTLRVSPSDARVEVDGAARPGSGEQRAVQLDPGRHLFRVSAIGAVAESFELTVTPGQRIERAVRLADAPTQVRLSVEPANAEVLLDGMPIGAERLLSPSPGTHVFEVRSSGRRSVRRVVQLSRGQLLALTLVAPVASTNVFTTPVFWIITGGVVVAGAVVAGALLIRIPADPYAGSTGFVLQAITARGSF